MGWLFSWVLGTALAQNAVDLEVRRRVPEGGDPPAVTFVAHVVGQIDAQIACGGRSYKASEAIHDGKRVVVELKGLAKGSHSCQGELTVTEPGGASGTMSFPLTVEILGPLAVEVRPEDLDLQGHRVRITASRPLSKASVEIIGEHGLIGGGEVAGGGQTVVDVEWSGEGEPLKVLIKAWDEANIPAFRELFPWSYAIPHDDVIFPSGSAEIADAELPKLETAWREVEDVQRRFGPIAQVRLYVAGYTDTVGPAASNQALSQDRARAIAQWFRRRGFTGKVASQGFGEEVLAAGTPDNTDSAANRRAVYVLASEAPQAGGEFPRSDWAPVP